MITINRKFDILFNKISEMFKNISQNIFYQVSDTSIKKMSFYSNNGIITIRFIVEPEEYESYTLYATLIQKENNGELYFQFYYSDKEKAELCKLKQWKLLQILFIFSHHFSHSK